MVDTGKELADVAFEHPAGAGVVFGDLIGKATELIHCFVRTLPYAARVTFIYESAVEERVKLAVQCMMEQAVAYASFVDVARLGVGDFEMFVAAVSVSLTY